MTYEAKSKEAITQIETLCGDHPWTIIWGICVAVVFALLAIAVAIEALNREH